MLILSGWRLLALKRIRSDPEILLVAFLALLPEQPSFRVRGYANRPRRTQVCDGTMKVRK